MKLKLIGVSVLAFSVIGCASTNNYYVKDNQNISTQNIGTKYVPVQRYVRVFDDVYEDIPYEDCYNKRVKVYEDRPSSSDPGAVIIGSVIGGLLGNEIGRKSRHRFDRQASRIGGVVIGGLVGSSISASKKREYTGYYDTKRVCKQRYKKQKRRVLAGYDNIGYYNGVEIVKFSPRKLREIPVNINISY